MLDCRGTLRTSLPCLGICARKLRDRPKRPVIEKLGGAGQFFLRYVLPHFYCATTSLVLGLQNRGIRRGQTLTDSLVKIVSLHERCLSSLAM